MAEQGSAARLVEVALAEVGTIEGPKDNEKTNSALNFYDISNSVPF